MAKYITPSWAHSMSYTVQVVEDAVRLFKPQTGGSERRVLADFPTKDYGIWLSLVAVKSPLDRVLYHMASGELNHSRTLLCTTSSPSSMYLGPCRSQLALGPSLLTPNLVMRPFCLDDLLYKIDCLTPSVLGIEKFPLAHCLF